MRAAFAITSIIAIALSLACSVTSSPLSPSSQICANDGTTKAGTIFAHRSLAVSRFSAPLESRTIPVPCNWCLSHTATFLAVRAFADPSARDPSRQLIRLALAQLYDYVNDLIRRQGDGVIENGFFQFTRYGVEWYIMNANNHQTTRGVMRSAILTLIDFCEQNGEYGYAAFNIYDGFNQVGKGVVRPLSAPTSKEE